MPIDLKFENNGCCGSHQWAEVKHSNGLTTTVYDDSGSYSAITHGAGMVIAGLQAGLSMTEVQARLAADAELAA